MLTTIKPGKSTLKTGQIMGGGYHQGKMHTDVNSSMVVSEFADVALHVKPIRGQNDEARTKIKEGFARNYP